MTPARLPAAALPATGAPSPTDPLLDLAGRLAVTGTLTDQVDTTLPLLAEQLHATVTVFAVAGSRAAGVRCWPHDAGWAEALRQGFAASWEAGPMTLWFRRAGVVPALPVEEVMSGWGTEPGRVLEHGGRVLHRLLIIPIARTGATIAAYFAARHEEPFGDAEIALARRFQPVVVASHGRFLRPPDPALTARQQSVLRLLAEGRTVRAIGSRLGISQSTVDKHVRDLYRRLGTQDRASTIRAAQVRGLLDGLVGEDWQDLLITTDPHPGPSSAR
ncbi:response regulator transcription factor [Microlunatus flavus]|uniref:Regulatory protein, luxR family n=1 Tax=Microlunatus flavus TaxID=1036181 RepID=A0A1H9MZS2_9ACTN|nr:LuxR C-terminal-related transcriptional regulator [Microlunatus flavus]SER29226.1 regulatory protein, luxR family [Microlunatus flavus]